MVNNKVFELTIYSVKDIKLDTFQELRAKVFQFLRESDGYYEGTTYRSLKNKATFVDYVIWDSQDGAKSAAQAFAESSLHVELSNAIEKAQLHDYSALLQDGELGDMRNLSQNDVIELGAFKLNSEKLPDFNSSRPVLFNKIMEHEGCKLIRGCRSIENPLLYFDFLRWSDLDTALRVAEEIHKIEQCGIFMNTIEQDLFFDHLEIYSE